MRPTRVRTLSLRLRARAERDHGAGAGRPARDHLARADEQRTSRRSGRPVRTDPRTGSTARSIPKIRTTRIIQDLDLAPRNARGKVEYVATFALAKPVDLSKSARVLLYQVVNRGNGQATANRRRRRLARQRLAGGRHPDRGEPDDRRADRAATRWLARSPAGHRPFLRCSRRHHDSAPIRLASLGTPQPYPPADLAQPDATLTWHTRENYAGEQDATHSVRTRRLGVSPIAIRRRGPARPTRRASA